MSTYLWTKLHWLIIDSHSTNSNIVGNLNLCMQSLSLMLFLWDRIRKEIGGVKKWKGKDDKIVIWRSEKSDQRERESGDNLKYVWVNSLYVYLGTWCTFQGHNVSETPYLIPAHLMSNFVLTITTMDITLILIFNIKFIYYNSKKFHVHQNKIIL